MAVNECSKECDIRGIVETVGTVPKLKPSVGKGAEQSGPVIKYLFSCTFSAHCQPSG